MVGGAWTIGNSDRFIFRRKAIDDLYRASQYQPLYTSPSGSLTNLVEDR